MRRISVINQKGGVGKTTSTVNAGAALAQMGKRVLLIDLDPQAHLTLHLGVDVADDQPTAYDVLTQSMPLREVVVEARENLMILPADIDLAGAEAELISVMGREIVLREALAPVMHEYDFIMIDCPPSLGVLTINALAASTEVLIPLQAQFFALQGLSKLLDTVTLVRQRINTDLLVSGVVLCIHESATRLGNEVVADLMQFLDGARGTDVPWSDACLFKTRIRRNIKLAEASSFGQTVIEYAPKSHGACDYSNLARELLGELPAETPVVAVAEAEPVIETPPVMASSEPECQTVQESPGADEVVPQSHKTPEFAPTVDVAFSVDVAPPAGIVPPRRVEPVPFEPQELANVSNASTPTVRVEEPENVHVPAESPLPVTARHPQWDPPIARTPPASPPYQDGAGV
jgi:chromosome partitioning protein